MINIARAFFFLAWGFSIVSFAVHFDRASAQIMQTQPVIELLPRASVNGARVYLSDIARCSGSVTICRETSGIDVWASPLPGRSAFIQKAVVESILAKEWPDVVVMMAGAESTRVEAAAADLALDDVRFKLQNLITTRTKSVASHHRVSIQKIQSLGAINVRPTQSVIDFYDLDSIPFENADWVTKNLIGNRMIQFRSVNPADPEDKANLQVNVTFAVDRYVPVLKKPLPAGQLISESNVEMAWVAMRRGYQDFGTSSDSLLGRKSRQSLSSGEPVALRYLESPMAVGRNQLVTMIVRKGDLEIAARATTIDQGAIGQTVQVVNMANKLRMRARVIDEKTVEAVSF